MLSWFFQNFKKNSPEISLKSTLILGLASGLYPLIYIYTNNFSLLSSWYQFLRILGIFVLLPILVFIAIRAIVLKLRFLDSHLAIILIFLNLLWFASLIIYATYGLNTKLILLIFIASAALSAFVFMHINKLVKFQLLLASIGAFFLIPSIIKYFNYSDFSAIHNDYISEVKFKITPNIYLIQPDGYVGFSEMEKTNYNFDNNKFKIFLESSNFTLYPDYRSNYPSTLSSNSALFGMKHHYYNYDVSKSELLFARDIIVGNNPVLSILKRNGYETSLILENSYLLLNRPSIAYDYCNIDFDELPLIGNGFEFKKNVIKDLELALEKKDNTPQFYFIEKISPGHIATYESYSKGKDLERLKYLDNINEANKWLTEMINIISNKDPDALIIIASDHGGYVGFDYTAEAYKRPKKDENVYSMFSSLLAIKWPNNVDRHQIDSLTAVNLFRSLFSNFNGEEIWVNSFEKNSSYLKIYEGKNQGLFEVINNNEITFKRISN